MKKSFFSPLPKRYYYISLFFFLVLFGPGVLLAQDKGSGGSGSPLSFGVKFGTAISTFSNGQPHNNITLGLNVGGFANYTFSDKFSLETNLLYAQEGGRLLTLELPYYIGEDNWYDFKVMNRDVVLHNLNIPVLFKYKLNLNGLKVAAFIGPDFGFTLKAISSDEVTVFNESEAFQTYKDNEDITSEIESYNFAATAGLGIEMPFGGNIIFVEGRYRYGITPVYKGHSYIQDVPQISGDLNSKSINLTIGIGF